MAPRRSAGLPCSRRGQAAVRPLLDSHCHVDAYPDPRAVLAEAASAGVEVVAVTETPDAYRRFRTRVGKTAGVSVALGLHPASRAAAAPGQLERFLRMLPDAPWIGEVGLDFPPGTGSRERTRQTRAFAAILEHGLARAKPMTVHSRGAAKEVVGLLTQARQRAVLHWYSGGLTTADDALAAGMWFSVNPSMVRSTKGRAVIERLPRSRVLCETDGPYCAVNGVAARPVDVGSVARALGTAWSMSEADAVAILASNRDVFLNDSGRSA